MERALCTTARNYPLLLDTLEKQGHYDDLLNWKNQVREDYLQKKRPLVAGVGVCAEVEDTGSQFTETARLVFEKNGNLTLYTGSSPHGQGLETSLAQLVSEEMEVPLEKIRVIYGDTELIPSGIGTFGSRSMADWRQRGSGGFPQTKVSSRTKRLPKFWSVPKLI